MTPRDDRRPVLRLALPPLAIATVLFALWIAILAVPGAWLLAAILIVRFGLLIPSIVAGTVATVLIAVFWRYNRVSGITMLAALIATVLLSVVPNVATSPSRWIAEVAQVIYYRPVLQRRAEELASKGVSPAVSAVGIDGFGSATLGLAYDPTGEILLPSDKRSKQWAATAEQTELGVEGLSARHIIGDYYSWFYD